MAKTARQEMDEELEQFEDDLNKSANDDDEFEDLEGKLDLEDDEDLKEEDTDQKVEDPSEEEDEVKATDDQDEKKIADQEDEPEAKLYTLPDDKDAFGELAGQRVTTEQLEEADLLEKAITWGHQGRHEINRNREELEETKKVRALLEEQLGIIKDDRKKADEPPALAPDKAAEALVAAYSADFDALGKAGAIEDSFYETYPKVAAQIEHRFRSGSEVILALVEKMTDLVEGHEKRTKVETQQETQDHLYGVINEASKAGEIFEPLGQDEFRKDFMKWATAEESTLNWVDKDVSDVTKADITASLLLYLHENPDLIKVKANKEDKDKEKRLAGGGGSGNNAPNRKPTQLDEFQQFEVDLKKSLDEAEY